MLTQQYQQTMYFTIGEQTLEDIGISISSFENVTIPQVFVDKLSVKINQIPINDSVQVQNAGIVIDPVFQGLCQISATVSYANGIFGGQINPIDPKFAVGSLSCSATTYSQVNMEQDAYFTIVVRV